MANHCAKSPLRDKTRDKRGFFFLGSFYIILGVVWLPSTIPGVVCTNSKIMQFLLVNIQTAAGVCYFLLLYFGKISKQASNTQQQTGNRLTD